MAGPGKDRGHKKSLPGRGGHGNRRYIEIEVSGAGKKAHLDHHQKGGNLVSSDTEGSLGIQKGNRGYPRTGGRGTRGGSVSYGGGKGTFCKGEDGSIGNGRSRPKGLQTYKNV